MPSNHSSSLFHYLCGKHPNQLGWLLSPKANGKTALREWVPFALDNDAFSAYKQKIPWDELAWVKMLDWIKASPFSPLWMLLPDVVTNKDATTASWNKYHSMSSAYGWPLAFALQDGMSYGDVPAKADYLFLGGSTTWKWDTVKYWSQHGLPLHVGRVNEGYRLVQCEEAGVKTVDGTGWFRVTMLGRQGKDLISFLQGSRNFPKKDFFYAFEHIENCPEPVSAERANHI